MKDSKQRVDMFSTGEHLTCNRYSVDLGYDFIYKEFMPDETVEQSPVRYNHLLFVLKGVCTVSCNDYTKRTIRSGEAILIPRGATFCGRSLTPIRIVDMVFVVPLCGCDKLLLQELGALCGTVRYDFRPLAIRRPLTAFLEQLIFCMNAGLNCAHFHEVKHREAFLLLKQFYDRKELAELFFPIVAKSLNFKEFIYESVINNIYSLTDLVDRSHMGRKTFYRKFKSEFGESPHSWLLKHLRQRIIREIAQPDITVKWLVDKFGFTSPSAFTRFCRTNFQCTPTELLKRYGRTYPTHEGSDI